MPTTALGPAKVSIPAQVLAFANEQGLAPHLPALTGALERLLADASRISVEVHEDLELAGLRCILVEADAPWSKEQFNDAMRLWYREFAALCPGSLRHLFSLNVYRRP